MGKAAEVGDGSEEPVIDGGGTVGIAMAPGITVADVGVTKALSGVSVGTGKTAGVAGPVSRQALIRAAKAARTRKVCEIVARSCVRR